MAPDLRKGTAATRKAADRGTGKDNSASNRRDDDTNEEEEEDATRLIDNVQYSLIDKRRIDSAKHLTIHEKVTVFSLMKEVIQVPRPNTRLDEVITEKVFKLVFAPILKKRDIHETSIPSNICRAPFSVKF